MPWRYEPVDFTDIYNGNRTEWSFIWSVIKRVINKVGRPRSGSSICLIRRMITNKIGYHSLVIELRVNYNNMCDVSVFFEN